MIPPLLVALGHHSHCEQKRGGNADYHVARATRRQNRTERGAKEEPQDLPLSV